MADFYEILGVTPKATDDEIKKAFRVLAVKYHPDKHYGNEAYANIFIQVKAAYDILSDSKKRADYDKKHIVHQSSKTTSVRSNKKRKRDNAFSNFYDRSRQETPQERPKYDLWGQKLDNNLEFLSYPKQIGRILSAHSSLYKNQKPKSLRYKILIYAFGILTGLAGATFLYMITDRGLAGFILGFTFIASFLLWLLYHQLKFAFTNLYVGINGFSEHKYSGSRENQVVNFEVNFRDITDLYYYETPTFRQHMRARKEYYYAFLNFKKGFLIYSKRGEYGHLKLNPELMFCRDISNQWTLYLLDNMEKMLEKDGYILFNLFSPESKRHTPYIKLGIRQITFIKGEKQEFTYHFGDIKNVYSRGNYLYIEHKNFKKHYFFIQSGNTDKIPVLNLCNRSFFYKAMEILVGFRL